MEQKIIDAFKDWKANVEGVVIAHAPGRVNLVGDHTDYNEGLVLPMIIDQGIYVVARETDSQFHHLRSENFNDEILFRPNQWPEVSHGHWATYVAGMIQEMPPSSPVEMLIMGDIPVGAGLSSSAALEMAVGLALEQFRDGSMLPLELAQVGQKVEHQYVEVKCGIMDQIVSRVGRSGHALFLDCRSLKWEHIPIESEGITFCVLDSSVNRQLATSKYNERREQCQIALQLIQDVDPLVASLRDVESHHLDYVEDSILRRRIRHVLHENERVINARNAIFQSDWPSLGKIFSASHISLRDDYQVSCEELDFMVNHAESLQGVLGTRMMGGGFGGCTINLVRAENAFSVVASISSASQQMYHKSLPSYILGAGVEAGSRWI